MDRVRVLGRRTLLVTALSLPAAAVCAPSEIKVFTDELASYGDHTLETHVNKAGRPKAADSTASNPLRVMPEYSYGIWKNWEFSLQLPFAFESGGSRSEGYRAELQYVAPHHEEQGFYWGVNVEVAYNRRIDEATFWNLELVPILGYRLDRWHVVVNPAFDKAISGATGEMHFQPAAKIAYGAGGKNYLGAEYYVDAGPLNHPQTGNNQTRTLYLVWDGKIGKSDINVGVGRGLTDVSDRWVVKTVFEVSF